MPTMRWPVGVCGAIDEGAVHEAIAAALYNENWNLAARAVADLTNYFCTEVCSPVIGRAMVYVDGSHITQTFARTLAPYLYPFVRKALAHSPN